MDRLLLISQLIAAVVVMASILMQQRGSSLGNAFGGESSVYRSRRGVEKWLFYLSIIASLLFIGLTIATLLI